MEETWRLASFAGTFTLIEHGVQLLVENMFSDDELPAFKQFDQDRQMKLAARLIDLAEQLRDVQGDLDLVVHELTSALHEDAPA